MTPPPPITPEDPPVSARPSRDSFREPTPLSWGTFAGVLAMGAAALVWSAGCAQRGAVVERSAQAQEVLDGDRVRSTDSGGTSGSGGAAITPTVLSEEDWPFAGREGKVIRTVHYRLFTTESDPVLRNRMPDFLERAMAHYRSAVTPLPAPPQKLDTYLMDTRPQWQTLTRQLMGAEAETVEQIQRGGYASRGFGVYFDIGPFDTLSIAAHEGWHQYTQRTFREPLPVWLEEGLATYMEGHRWRQGRPEFLPWANIERFDALRRAVVADELIGLEELFDARPQDFFTQVQNRSLTYYAQVWALVHFLMEGEGGTRRGAFGALVTDAASGALRERLSQSLGKQAAAEAMASRRGGAAARVYFGDLKALESEYRAFVARLARVGAREAIAAGRSPM